MFTFSVAGYFDEEATQYMTAFSMWLGFTAQTIEFFVFSLIGAAVFLLLRRLAKSEAFANLHWLVPTVAFAWILPTAQVFPYLTDLLRFLPILA